jgi:hypothetical protein
VETITRYRIQFYDSRWDALVLYPFSFERVQQAEDEVRILKKEYQNKFRKDYEVVPTKVPVNFNILGRIFKL